MSSRSESFDWIDLTRYLIGAFIKFVALVLYLGVKIIVWILQLIQEVLTRILK